MRLSLRRRKRYRLRGQNPGSIDRINAFCSEWRSSKDDPYFAAVATEVGAPIYDPRPRTIPGEEWAIRRHLYFEEQSP